MAIKKQLKDKDGNTIYPDVGLDLDSVVYSDDPTEPVENPEPWIETTDITNNAVTGDKIDWSTMKSPHPLGAILNDYGTITSSTSITPTENCFLIGKAVVLGSNSAAEIFTTVSNVSYIIGGIPYYASTAGEPNFQIGICILLKKGQTYNFRVSNSGRFEQIKTVKVVWA